MTIRVQIPVYTDHWMRGDRYGELVKTMRRPAKGYGKMIVTNPDGMLDIAHVKLEKSGKTIRVLLDDCQWVS